MKPLILSLLLVVAATPTVYAQNTNDYAQRLNLVTSANGSQQSYQQLIEQSNLTGLSLAVIDNYKVVFSHSAGLKEAGTDQLIDKNTAFSTASISKPVTATLAFMLAEQGKLDLDKPVQHYLTRWTIPTSPLTKNTPVTLRHLLSHTAGTTQGGFVDFYLGDDIPTPIDSLNGVKVPRYNTPIAFMFEPGTDWQYSGGGYVIAQIAMEDVTGKPLAELAETLLFHPLDMQHTTMHQHGDKGFLTNVAKVHDGDQQVIGTGIPICPQIAPSGMWSTPEDMAKLIIAFQQALAGNPGKVISQEVAQNSTEILSIDNIGSWGFGGWSAGWMRFEGDGNREWFSHGGSNTGTGGHVMGSMTEGKGLIVFGNGPSPIRIPVINTIKAHVIDALGWQQQTPEVKTKGLPTQLTQIKGRYLSSFEHVISIEQRAHELVVKNLHGQGSKKPLVHLGNGRFAMHNSHIQIGMEQGELTFYRKGTTFRDQSVRKLGEKEKLPIEVAKTAGFADALAAYQNWKVQHPTSRLHAAASLNRSGYVALSQKDIALAITLFKVYVHMYPADANAYDSLGEAYMLKGNNTLAAENYQKSLSLNPQNDNAKKMLKKLAS